METLSKGKRPCLQARQQLLTQAVALQAGTPHPPELCVPRLLFAFLYDTCSLQGQQMVCSVPE